MESHDALAIGAELATDPGNRRYRIDGIIGQGGFGIAYRATELGSERPVVVKEYLPTEFAIRGRDSTTVVVRHTKNMEAFERGLNNFLREAEIVRGFDEESIVKVLDVFRANGTAYFVMPFEDSETLAERLERTATLSEEELRGVFLQLLDGLRAVHDAGYLHRDIKPNNILLRKSDGRPVLIDFGAARQALLDRSRSISLVLTPGYAPPEQYTSSSKKQGPWTDLYAVGATMYRCVSGLTEQQMNERSSLERRDALHEKLDDPLRPAAVEFADRYDPTILQAIDWMLHLEANSRASDVRQVQACLLGRAAVPQPHLGPVAEPPEQPPPLKADDEPWFQRFAHLLVAACAILVVSGLIFWKLVQPGGSPQATADSADAAADRASESPAANPQPTLSDPRLRPVDDSRTNPAASESPQPTKPMFSLTVDRSPPGARVILANMPPDVSYTDPYVTLETGAIVVRVVADGYEPAQVETTLDRDMRVVAQLCRPPIPKQQCTQPPTPTCTIGSETTETEVTGYGSFQSDYGQMGQSEALSRAKRDARDSLGRCDGDMGAVRYRDSDCSSDYQVVNPYTGLSAYSYDCSVEAFARCTVTTTTRDCPPAASPTCTTSMVSDPECPQSTISIQ